MPRVKKCQICGKPATMFLTQIVNGQVTELAFCEECARAKGLFDPQALTFAEKFFPEKFKERINNLVRELGEGAGTARQKPAPLPPSANLLTECPVCHFTLENYRRTERLGCPDCYRVFAQELFADPSVEMPADEPSVGEKSSDGASPALTRKQLEAELARAVEREDYETAARLRDQLNNLR